jgi:hypothetical protein
MTSNSHIFSQMKTDAIDEALQFFGMGGLPGRREDNEICCVFGEVVKIQQHQIEFDVQRYEQFRHCVFIKELIWCEWITDETALISVPKTFLPVFLLWDFVLDEPEIAEYRKRAEIHNAPYLPPTSVKPVEKIGRMRI